MFEFNFNLYNLIIIASVFIGATFGFLLIFTNRVNKKANIFLGLVMLIMVLWNIWVLSLDLYIARYFPNFHLIPLNYSLALGALIYMYVKKMTNPSFVITKKKMLHFLPLVFELLVHSIIITEALNKNILATDTSSFYKFSPIVQFIGIISIVTYCIYSLKEIRKYHIWLAKNYSNDIQYSLNWLYRLLVIFAIFWFLFTPYTIVDYVVYDFNLGIGDYYPLYILLSLITIWISAEAFLRPEIILLENNSKINHIKENPSFEIVEKASWLKEQMETNLFYLNSELTLRSLAEDLEIHPNTLSKIINDGLGKKFSDFVNEYRVHAIIDKLNSNEYDNITLLGISFECGFNSKTTFNRVFKTIKGVTPIEYKKSIK
jgi:AraC-like DNA-binding protein